MPTTLQSLSSALTTPLKGFLAYLRVEAGLSKSTLEAYERDLCMLIEDLQLCSQSNSYMLGLTSKAHSLG